jgi:hypothetical protein
VGQPPSRSLSDQHGEWCAVCLGYFVREDVRHFHHVLTRKWVKDRFGSNLDFAWLIPVHGARCGDDQFSCHQRIQVDTDRITLRFLDKLGRENSLAKREQSSRQLYDRGYYWLSVLGNLDSIRTRIEGIDREQLIRRCEFALSSAAGVRGGQNLPRLLLGRVVPGQSPRIRLNLANLQAARGHEVVARRTLRLVTDIAELLPKKERESLRPGFLRRGAQLSRSPADARVAVGAAESNYSRDTALVIQGVLGVSSLAFRYVEESLEELSLRGDAISWLYRAEKQFIHGLFLIRSGSNDLARIYSLLCEAQYIYVLLGLQFSISPKLPFEGPPDRSWDWTPSDVLRSHFTSTRKNALSRIECYDIRRRTIGDSGLKRTDTRTSVGGLTGWVEEPGAPSLPRFCGKGGIPRALSTPGISAGSSQTTQGRRPGCLTSIALLCNL